MKTNHLIALIAILFWSISAHAETWTTITINDPGTLETKMRAESTSKLANCRIDGALNWEDLKFLSGTDDMLNNIEQLDLRGVTLIPGGESYSYLKIYSTGISTGSLYFYISEDNTVTWNTSDWLGNSISTGSCRGNGFGGVFANFTSLHTVYLPEYMTEVGTAAFIFNKSLQNVILGSKVRKISDWAFNGTSIESLELPTSVTQIGSYAFQKSELVSLGGTNNITTIGYAAFDESKIQQFNFSSVREIGANAFRNSSLKAANLPEGLRMLEPYSFDCPELTSLSIPTSVDSITPMAVNCPWLDAQPGEDGIVYLNTTAYNIRPDYGQVIRIKEGTTHIVDNFWANRNQKLAFPNDFSIEIPSTMKYIGKSAFEDCYNLRNIKFPEKGNIYVKSSAFKAENISCDVFPASLHAIERDAFSGIQYVNYRVPSVKTDGDDPFGTAIYGLLIGSEVDSIPGGFFSGSEAMCELRFEDRTPERPIYIGDGAFARGQNPTWGNIRYVYNFPKYASYIGGDFATYSSELPTKFDKPVDLSNIKGIGAWVFRNATSAFPGTTLVLPPGLKYIGEGAFGDMPFTHVEIQCDSLVDVTMPFVSNNFGAMYGETFTVNTTLKTVYVGKNVRHLPRHLFLHCQELEKVEFEERDHNNAASLRIGAEVVGTAEFYNHYGFTSKVAEWDLPYGTQIINAVAFDKALARLTIPETVQKFCYTDTIEGKYYYPDPNKKYSGDITIYTYAPIPPEGSNYFANRFSSSSTIPSTVTVYVPARNIAAYRANKYWQTANLQALPDQTIMTIDGLTYIATDDGPDENGVINVIVTGGDESMSNLSIDLAFEHNGNRYRTTGIGYGAFANRKLEAVKLHHSCDWQPETFTFEGRSFYNTEFSDFSTDVTCELVFEPYSFERLKLGDTIDSLYINTNATFKTWSFKNAYVRSICFDNEVDGILRLYRSAFALYYALDFNGITLEGIDNEEGNEDVYDVMLDLILGKNTAEIKGMDNVLQSCGYAEVMTYPVVPPKISGLSARRGRVYYSCFGGTQSRYAESWPGCNIRMVLCSYDENGYFVSSAQKDEATGSYYSYNDKGEITEFLMGATDKTVINIPTTLDLWKRDHVISNVWPYSLQYNRNLREVNFGSTAYPERVLTVGRQLIEPYVSLDNVNVVNADFNCLAFANPGNAIKNISISRRASCEHGLQLGYCSIKNVYLGPDCTDATALGWDGEYTGEYGLGNLSPDVVITSDAKNPPLLTPCPDEIYRRATVVIPADAIAAYKNAPVWKEFVSIKSMGVDDVMADNERIVTVVYTMDGRYSGNSTDNLSAGIYIVRYSDGTARTIQIK